MVRRQNCLHSQRQPHRRPVRHDPLPPHRRAGVAALAGRGIKMERAAEEAPVPICGSAADARLSVCPKRAAHLRLSLRYTGNKFHASQNEQTAKRGTVMKNRQTRFHDGILPLTPPKSGLKVTQTTVMKRTNRQPPFSRRSNVPFYCLFKRLWRPAATCQIQPPRPDHPLLMSPINNYRPP
jgi:hypothetical protein